MTQGERITALEVQVASLREEQQEMNRKLDELLTLRSKGIGAFWLASTLFGTTMVGLAGVFLNWLRG